MSISEDLRVLIPNTELEEIEILGQGGFGTVYRAYCPTLCRHVALKILSVEHLTDKTLRERFLREAQALSQTSHPNLVTIFSFGFSKSGTPYYIMEFVAGRTLAQTQGDNHLSLERSIEIFKGIVRGVGAMHHSNLVHRDLTPSNCIVAEDGNGVKIIDFGLIKNICGSSLSQTLTKTGQIMGTFAYMSPEACTGDPVETRSDIYSLGCLLYFMMTGRPPFGAYSAEQQLVNHVFGDVEPVGKARADKRELPNIDRIIAKCMEKKPENRYRTTEELETDLHSDELFNQAAAEARPRLSLAVLFFSLVLLLTSLVCAVTRESLESGRSGLKDSTNGFRQLPQKAVSLSTAILTQSVGYASFGSSGLDNTYGTIRTALVSGKLSSLERKQLENVVNDYESSIGTNARDLVKILRESKPILTVSQTETLIKCGEKCYRARAERECLDIYLAIGECLVTDAVLQQLRTKIAKDIVEHLRSHGSVGDDLSRCGQITSKMTDLPTKAALNVQLSILALREKNPVFAFLIQQVASWATEVSVEEIEPYLQELRQFESATRAADTHELNRTLLECLIRIDKKQNDMVYLGNDLWLQYSSDPKHPDHLLRESVRCFEKDGFGHPACLYPLIVLAAHRCDFTELPLSNPERSRKIDEMKREARYLLGKANLCLQRNHNIGPDVEYLYLLVSADSDAFAGDFQRGLDHIQTARIKFIPQIIDHQARITESVRLDLRTIGYLLCDGKSECAMQEARKLRALIAKESKLSFNRQELFAITDQLEKGQVTEALRAIDPLLNKLPVPLVRRD